MKGRYDVIMEIIEAIKPKSFIEVGVHKGDTAERVCNLGSLYCSEPFKYIGYDLWENLNNAKEAFHGKGSSTYKEVDDKLKTIDNLDYELIPGDTRETLKLNEKKFDMAFIDGDHRAPIIQQDYDNVTAETIIFDDHYTPAIPDLGCNYVDVNKHEHKWKLISLDVQYNNSFFNNITTRISLIICTNNKILNEYLHNREDMEEIL